MSKYFWSIFLVWSGLHAGTLSGKVTANGQAVENASVYVYDRDFLCIANLATTDASGNYQVQVDDGSYYVLVSGENLLFRYLGNSPTRRELATATLVNVAGNTTRNITAQLGGSITGRVSINGGSIQDAEIFVVDPYDPKGFSFNLSINNLENDGDYQIHGLETGCYLIGLAYRQGDLAVVTPMAYYPGTLNITNATRLDVTAGETRDGVDFSLNTADLGTLQLTINPGGFQHRPSATLIDSRGYYYGVSLNQSAQTSIKLPPETYKVYVSFDELYLPVEVANVGIQAGQTTSRTLNPNVGGSISGTITSPGLGAFQANVQVLREDTGSLVDSMSFSPAVPGQTPYIFTGLADGNYVVRVDHNPSIPGDSIMRTYFFEVDSLTQASTLTISGGNTISGIDFALQPGGSIQGDLLANGQPVSLPLISLYAVETQTNEVYELPLTITQPYSIGGLTAGNYRVGTYFSTTNGSLFSGLSSNFLCSNASPSYYNNTGTQANATPVTVQFGQTVTDIDINLFKGGGVSGRILGADCDCPLQTGLIGLFQSGKLVRLAINLNGQYEVNGLNGGNYQMKLALVNAGDLPEVDLEDVDLQNFNFFDLLPTYDYPGTVSVTQGSFTGLNDWCVPLQPTGNGDPGGNGGGGGDNQTSLLYAWISNNAGQFESILIANNYGDTDVTATLTARRANGASQSIQRTILAHGFLEEAASSLFPGLGNGAGYAVVLEAASDDIRGRWVTNNLQSASGQSPSQGVAVEIPAQGESNERVGEQVLFGYLPVTNTFNAAPVIVNIGENATDVDLTFYNTSGTMVGNFTINDLQPLLPAPVVANSQVPGTGDVYMIASSGGEPITGVAFIFNGGNETAIANVTAIDPAATDTGAKTLIYPWISNRSGQFRSILVADNLSDQMVNVTLTARRRNEAPIMANRQIPAGGFLQETASDLFPSLDGAGYTVELTANSSKVLGQWVTNNLEAASGNSPSQGIAVDITGSGDKELVGDTILFGYLPVTNTFVSAPVVVNAGNSATDIVLYFYDKDGTEVLRDTTTLAGANPKEPFAAVANSLVSGDKNVYMVARSGDGSPLTGVVFVFNSASEPAIGNATAIEFTPPQ